MSAKLSATQNGQFRFPHHLDSVWHADAQIPVVCDRYYPSQGLRSCILPVYTFFTVAPRSRRCCRTRPDEIKCRHLILSKKVSAINVFFSPILNILALHSICSLLTIGDCVGVYRAVIVIGFLNLKSSGCNM